MIFAVFVIFVIFVMHLQVLRRVAATAYTIYTLTWCNHEQRVVLEWEHHLVKAVRVLTYPIFNVNMMNRDHTGRN